MSRTKAELVNITNEETGLNAKLAQNQEKARILQDEIARIPEEKPILEKNLRELREDVRNKEISLHNFRKDKPTLETKIERLDNLIKSHYLFNIVRELIQGLERCLNALCNKRSHTPVEYSLTLDQNYIERLELIHNKACKSQNDLDKIYNIIHKVAQEKTVEQVEVIAKSLSKIKNLSELSLKKSIDELETIIHKIRHLDSAFQQVYNRFTSLNLDHILGLTLVDVNDSPDVRDLVRGLVRFRELARTHTLEHDQTLVISRFLRNYVRLGALACLTKQLLKMQFNLSAIQGNKSRHLNMEPQFDICLDLYLNFSVLEERIEGNIPAFEGIWIVKERKP